MRGTATDRQAGRQTDLPCGPLQVIVLLFELPQVTRERLASLFESPHLWKQTGGAESVLIEAVFVYMRLTCSLSRPTGRKTHTRRDSACVCVGGCRWVWVVDECVLTPRALRHPPEERRASREKERERERLYVCVCV